MLALADKGLRCSSLNATECIYCACEYSNDADQTAKIRSLVSVVVVRTHDKTLLVE